MLATTETVAGAPISLQGFLPTLSCYVFKMNLNDLSVYRSPIYAAERPVSATITSPSAISPVQNLKHASHGAAVSFAGRPSEETFRQVVSPVTLRAVSGNVVATVAIQHPKSPTSQAQAVLLSRSPISTAGDSEVDGKFELSLSTSSANLFAKPRLKALRQVEKVGFADGSADGRRESAWPQPATQKFAPRSPTAAFDRPSSSLLRSGQVSSVASKLSVQV
jgi:hypothetical protein